MKKLGNGVLAGIMAVSLGLGAVALTGCDAVKGAVSQTTIGQKMMSSKTTDKSDRADCYKLVQDIDGNEYATVIWMEPLGGEADFDPAVCKNVLDQNNINWYQLIYSDAKQAPGVIEHGLLYMPASITLSDLYNVNNLLAGLYNSQVMTKQQYEEYLATAPSDNIMEGINIYERETTEFGPAAKTSQEAQ